MASAFQKIGFQNNAFQVDPIPPSTDGNRPMRLLKGRPTFFITRGMFVLALLILL